VLLAIKTRNDVQKIPFGGARLPGGQRTMGAFSSN
jgi:hypothetical protein